MAELGDKSQLMAMAFATRYKAWHVLIGITVATAVVHAFSVLMGGVVAVNLPTRAINIVAGLAFFAFAGWTIRGDRLSEEEENKARRSYRSPMIGVGIAFFLAELGDKTMLATITLAITEGWLGVWIGSTLGMVAADAWPSSLAASSAPAFPKRRSVSLQPYLSWSSERCSFSRASELDARLLIGTGLGPVGQHHDARFETG